MTRGLTERIRALVTALDPLDDLEAAHRAEALGWLASTSDLFRRQSRPVEPRQHLVSYFLLVADAERLVLLGDHLKSGLWLPSGGHVEPGEEPSDTVRRECLEELAIQASFHRVVGATPLFITITETNGSDSHRDVSLWYVLDGSRADVLVPDRREYRSVRWWSPEDIRAADPSRFDPHMVRMLDKVDSTVWRHRCFPDSAAGA